MAMPGSAPRPRSPSPKAEPMFKIKCDVHPWMGAYVAVMDHPYFDVTGKDGKFEIERPPGRAPTRSRPGTRSSRPRPPR